LNIVLSKRREFNIRFNPTKLQYCVDKVKLLGFNFSEEGVQSEDDRIKVIRELKEPNDKKQLQSFLGMINDLR